MAFPTKDPKYAEALKRINEWHPSLNSTIIYNRIKRGWSAEDAMLTKKGSNLGGRKANNPWNNFEINSRKKTNV